MKIRDIPEYHDKNEILMLDEKISVLDATKKMAEKNYGSTVVTRNGKLAGIFTERDLLTKIIGAGKKPDDLQLKDVMTTQVKTATEDDDVSKCLRRMSQGRFRRMPILDKNGDITGFITQGDFVAITWPEILERLRSKTQTDFINYTQLWMMVIVVLAYLTLVPLLSGMW